MAEPVVSNYVGGAALDNDTSLGGDQVNIKSFVLGGTIGSSETSIPASAAITGVNVPFYLLADSELIYVEGVSGSNFTPCVRGAGGTTAAAHTSGIPLYVVYAANLFNQLKRAIIAIETKLGVNPPQFNKGHLFGLTLSNNATDPTNDIDITTGEARDADHTEDMILASALVKRLDAAWAVGTNQGGLDTGVIANTTYHVFLIKRTDTGVVDVLFSTSATAPTMPTSYTKKRRIGSILRAAGAILVFTQIGNVFKLGTPVTNRSSTAAAGAGVLAVTVPLGVKLQPLLHNSMASNAGTINIYTEIGDGPAGAFSVVTQLLLGVDIQASPIAPVFFTDTSAQINFAVTFGSGTLSDNTLKTLGWIDTRGRLA